jgi:hypothetical protein
MKLPKVWNEPFTDYIPSALKNEAAKLFRIHQLPGNLEEWKTARENLRKNIWKSFGVRLEQGVALDYCETGVTKMDGYEVRNIYYQSRKDFYVTANLYVPEGKGPFPAVINVHGHWSQGRLAERVQDRGHSLAKNGYVCLAVDAFGSGERGTNHGEFEYHGSMLGGSLMNFGETLMGIQVVDNMRGVDLLCSFDFVDASKIGVTGASGGGNQTMWLAAMDDRIAAAMPVVSVGTFQSYIMSSNCICELLVDGLTYTEESGVLALVAPRALKICNCLKDSIHAFYPAEMLRSYVESRKIFQLYNSDDKLAYQIFNLPHGYWPEIREAMLGWFDLHLKGIGNGCPRIEIPFETLPEEKVMVFKKGERPAGVCSIADYCRRKGSALKKEFTAAKKIDMAAGRIALEKILRIKGALKLKTVHCYSYKDGWDRIALESECGRMLPLIIKKPSSKTNEYVILVAHGSKEKLADSKILTEALASGKGVLIPDLWATGETYECDNHDRVYLDVSRTLLWLGRTFIGEWCGDFGLISSYLKSSYPKSLVSVGGLDGAGIAALLFSAMEGKGIQVVLEKCPVSYVFHTKANPEYSAMATFIPEFLKWGDILFASALTCSDVRFIDPVFSDGTPLDKDGLAHYGKEFEGIKKKCGSAATVCFC